MTLQDSINASNRMSPGGEHVCVGCGVNATTHPSMICLKCRAGSPGSQKAHRKPHEFVPISREDFGDTGNDHLIEDIIDAIE
jgi:hypothetical protein